MQYLVFLAIRSNLRTLTKYTGFFRKLPDSFSNYLVKIHIFH